MPSTAANEVAAGWPELVAGIADVTPVTSVGAPGRSVWVTTEGRGESLERLRRTMAAPGVK